MDGDLCMSDVFYCDALEVMFEFLMFASLSVEAHRTM